MNLVENACAHTEKPILVFSMEMPAEQLVVRMMSSLGKIDQSRLRTGKLQQDDWPKLSAAMAKLKETTIFIDDTPALTPTKSGPARADFQGAWRSGHDHGGLPAADAGAGAPRAAPRNFGNSPEPESDRQGIPVSGGGAVAVESSLRAAAQQASRELDLRESGAIEQDADVVMFIYRDEVYHEDSPIKVWPRSLSASSVMARSAPVDWRFRANLPGLRISPGMTMPATDPRSRLRVSAENLLQ